MLGAESDSAALKDHKIPNDLRIIFKTNQLGAFEEIVNWKDVADYGLKASLIYIGDKLNKKEKKKFIKLMKETTLTKQGIQNTLGKNIDLFCFFHGGYYKLGEVYQDSVSVASIFSDKPINTYVTTSLNEILPEYGSYNIKYSRTIDSNSIIDSVNDLSKLAQNEVDVNTESLSDLNNETIIDAMLHESGWLVSLYTKISYSINGKINVQERYIQMVGQQQ